MARINHFTELLVWQKARIYSQLIFSFTQKEKFSRDFKLKDQLNDSSGSIMDNIAEGFGRSGKNEFVNFLTVANGSCTESQSQVYRAFDRKYISEEELNTAPSLGREIEKMNTSLISKLNKSIIPGFKFKDRI